MTSSGLIVPSKEKKKEKKSSKLLKKLGRSKTEPAAAEPQRAPGLVGLLETMRVQMEVSPSKGFKSPSVIVSILLTLFLIKRVVLEVSLFVLVTAVCS